MSVTAIRVSIATDFSAALDKAAIAGALMECAPGSEALALALAPFLAEPARAQAQGEAGRAYVGRVHDWEAIARATLRLYAGQGGQV